MYLDSSLTGLNKKKKDEMSYIKIHLNYDKLVYEAGWCLLLKNVKYVYSLIK